MVHEVRGLHEIIGTYQSQELQNKKIFKRYILGQNRAKHNSMQLAEQLPLQSPWYGFQIHILRFVKLSPWEHRGFACQVIIPRDRISGHRSG